MNRNGVPSIEYSSTAFTESCNGTVAAVARERKYLATTEGFSLESSTAFVDFIVSGNLPRNFLLNGGDVVGWCYIIPKPITEFGRVGVPGMGMLPDFRGKGWGYEMAYRDVLDGNRHYMISPAFTASEFRHTSRQLI